MWDADLMQINSNNIVYADDIVLLAPSTSGLQLLIHTVITEVSKISLGLDDEKTRYLVFKAGRITSLLREFWCLSVLVLLLRVSYAML